MPVAKKSTVKKALPSKALHVHSAKKVKPFKTIVKSEKMDEASAEVQMHARDVLIHPLVSEKAVNMIEGQNKLTFIVSAKASKKDVKKAMEDAYKVKVEGIQTLMDMKGRKKAIIRLSKEFKARDVATRIGIV